MKLHIPLFILGLLVFVSSYLGLTSSLETILFSIYGVVIMIISSTIKNHPDDINSIHLDNEIEDIEDIEYFAEDGDEADNENVINEEEQEQE